ncbi:MBG domain-containing protein [Myroides odoratus]|uniref:Por secretion system C-terminal sorting domain n=1 Tax=Myroides odoratus TaxID=256 RepID=A0A378RPI9_MYROD|nr:MBG domain-containing protein [Myroides odoratus]QQU04970.1 T9SS type A sorting domain-containing protein [Myroides odoratus]STZ27560.1 Por secretion system C-terminal sorting domain [Myroides odoratus]
MKKVLLFFVFILLFVQSFLLHAQPYQSLAMDGFNADVIANGVGAVGSSTTHDIDNSGHYLLAEDWKLDANQLLSGTGLPMNGSISSAHTPGMKFLLQNYSANNSIRLTTTISSVTSNLVLPVKARKLFVLTTAGLASTALDVTVIFEDDTTEIFSSRVPDWFNGTSLPVVHKNFGRLTRASVLEKPTDNPRLYQVTLNISKQNQLKKVKQIKFLRPISFEGVVNIFAVSTELLDSCPSPEFVEFRKLTMNSVVAAIELPVLPATTYQYELRTSGLPGSGDTGLVQRQDFSESNNQITLTSLANATTFFFYVRSFCSDTNQGYWKGPFTFTTLCNAVNTPYKVPFDTVDVPNAPACTTILNANEDDYTWITESSAIGFEGPVLRYRYNPTQAADDWFFTRGINVTRGETYRLRFKYRDKRFNEKLRISLGKFAYPEAMTTEIFNVDTGGTDQVTDKLIEFTADETGVLYIGFQIHSLADQFLFYLGDIEVTQSSCHRLLWGLSGWVCEGGPVTLEAQANYGTLRWYDSRTSTEVLGEGSTFVTPPLTESKSYYVKSYLEDSKGGKQSLSTNSNDTQTNATWGISFDLLDPGTIKSTTVYASQSGSIRVAILNSSGREVYVSNAIAINAAGPTVPITVPLNAELNAGNGYKMILKEVNNAKLFIDQKVLFPMYDSHNSLRVTSSLTPVENRAFYAYFFELVYQRACTTSGVMLDATVVKAVAPTVDQAVQTFCKSSNPILADITITGTNIHWYANETGGVALPNTTPLVHNRTYYASQFLYACESPRRTAVKVVLEEARLQTSGMNVHYNYGTDSQTVGTSIYNALGSTELQWYTEETGGLPVDTPAFSTLAVGNYDYWVSGVVNGCESIRSRIGMTVRPVSVWVTAQPTRKVYGEEDPALLYRVSGLVNDDELTGSLTRAPGEDVDTYVISRGTLAASSNYIFNVDNANFRILPATLTVTAADKTKVYGEEDPAFTYTVTGFKRGEEATAILSGALNRELGEEMGTYEIRQGSLTATANYEIAYHKADLEITPTVLTVTAQPLGKIYGDVDPLLTYTVSGLKLGDSAASALRGNLARTGDEAVGDYTITQGTLEANSNYTLVFEGADFTITPATITVMAHPKAKVYGAPEPLLTHTTAGLKRGESSATVLTGHLTRTGTEDVGIYTIEPGTLAANSNYRIDYVSADFEITPAELTVTAETKTKIYGDTDPALTYTVTGLQRSEEASAVLTGSLTRTGTEEVGIYTINQGNLLANRNYTLVYEAADFEITPATLTVTADAKTKIYGEIDPALTYTVSGLKRNDKTATTLTGSLVRNGREDIGTYAITQGSLVATPNYTLVYEGADFTITAAVLTVTANPQTKIYGDEDPVLEYTVAGLRPSDQLATVLTGNLVRNIGEAVGIYTINQGSLAVSPNYTLVYEEADFTIEQAILTVTANAQTKTYGEPDAVLSYTVAGLKNNDQETSITGVLVRDNGEEVGSYTIHQGTIQASTNYTLAFQSANLTIIPALLTIQAEAKTKVYGDADPVFTYIVSGLKNNDHATTILTGSLSRDSGEHVDTYSIHQGTIQASTNYTLDFQPANLTIIPALLTIQAEAKTKVYGDADPVFTYTVSGLKNNDQPNILTGILTRDNGEDVGFYSINQGNIQASTNYTLDFQPANLTIIPALLTIQAEAKTKVYGDADPVFTYTVSGLKNNDQTNILTGILTRDNGEDVGFYSINQGNIQASTNYTLAFQPANLAITSALLTVQAEAKTKVYGDADPVLTYIVSGLKNNDQATSILTGNLSRDRGEHVGTYGIQQGNLQASTNYTLDFQSANLIITTALLKIRAEEKTKVYGDADPILTYAVSGLKNNDLVQATVTGNLVRQRGENGGTYAIQQGDLQVGANYTFTFEEALFTITRATLNIHPVAGQQKRYGATDPILVFTVTGFKFNDEIGTALTGSLTRAAGENVNRYAYQIGSLQAVLANYSLTLDSQEKFEIKPAPLHLVVEENQFKQFGEADPVLRYRADGLQRGDFIIQAVTGQLTRSAGEAVGVYAIEQGSLTARANYYIDAFIPASFEIKKNSIKGLTLPAQRFVYDGQVKQVQVQGNIEPQATIVYTNNNQTQVGQYTVTATVDYGPNYEVLHLQSILTIVKADQEITWNQVSEVVLEDTPTLQLTARASSNLPVSYAIDEAADREIAVIEETGLLRFLQPGLVTITASQGGNANFNAAKTVTHTIAVSSRDASIWDLVVDGVSYGKIAKEVHLVLGCETQQDEVTLAVHTQVGAEVQPSNHFTLSVKDYGIYEQIITVQSPNRKVTETYKIIIDKRIPTENLVIQKYNNVLLVNNNKQTNGGYVFHAYRWFKNGALVGEKQAYSAGDEYGAILDPNATYQVELTLYNGKKIRSCPIVVKGKAAANWAVYPNPVQKSQWLYVQMKEEKQGVVHYIIYNLKGQLIKRGALEGGNKGIEIPSTAASGSYFLILKTEDTQEGVQFIIQ